MRVHEVTAKLAAAALGETSDDEDFIQRAGRQPSWTRPLHDEEGPIPEKLRRGERIDHFETTRVRKDGTRVPISLTVSPIRNRRGEIVAAAHPDRPALLDGVESRHAAPGHGLPAVRSR
jgi:PAS domain-containing protein